jgi:hypothetical protein
VSRRGRASLAPLAALVLLGCGERGDPGERSLRQLERLAFVPEGECRVPPYLACGNDRPLLVDRYEVTRGELSRWIEEEEVALPAAARAVVARWGSEEEDLPASFVSLEDARGFASWRGMRLPTAGEWLRIASGTRAQPWPWGYKAISVANTLELGLGRPLAVGTFEQGRTPLGTYDMIGNVREWVEGALGPGEQPALSGQAWAMGGSFLSRQRPLIELAAFGGLRFDQLVLDERHRAMDVGLRCAVEAEPYLRRQAPRFERVPRRRERLQAIGSGWGRASIPLLELLAAEPGAPVAFAELLAGARR